MSVTLTDAGLRIGQEIVPVYSGSVHYWRLERSLWPDILDRVKELGFGMVETYIPWAIHEIEPGLWDWGQIDDRKDIEAFIRLCEEKGLWLQVRPGPLINAELTYFGFPEWVIMNPDVQARTATGSLHIDSAWGLHPPHQYPAPSYASEAFYDAMSVWFDAICPILARHLAPDGAIVSVQSDNETCYFFHDQAYATDYSPDSIALYRQFLTDKHGDIDQLNELYRTSYGAFSEVEPPRDCGVETATDLPRHIDWVAYKEYHVIWAVARIARMMRDRGIDSVPIFHDVAYQEATPIDTGRMEADPEIDWVGINAYCNKEQYGTISKRARFLNGHSKLPYVPEFGCGLWSHHPKTFEPAEHEFITLSAFMNGLRAINFYMLVERERWLGSPVTRHATYRDDYAPFYRDLSAFLQKYPLQQSQRDVDRVVLFNFDIGRQAAALSTLHLSHVDLLGLPRELGQLHPDLGTGGDPHIEGELDHPESWLGEVFRTMNRTGRDYDLADTHILPVRLDRYRTAYVPSLSYMEEADQSMLLNWVSAGGNLVIGPLAPSRDPYLRPVTGIAALCPSPGVCQHGRGKITLVPTIDVSAVIAATEPESEFRPAIGDIQLSRHLLGDTKLLFAANPTDQTLHDTLSFNGPHRFTPVWGGGPLLHGEGALAITLDPYTVRIWEVSVL